MDKGGSVFSMGGGGTNFEQYVQTAFLTTLVVKGNSPCIPVNEITEVAFQVTNRGYKTDDLLVIAKSIGGEHRLLAQIKHNVSISLENETIKDVIKAFWEDYNNTVLFNKTNDRLLLIKSILTQSEKANLITVLNWAKTHATLEDFLSEIKREKSKEQVVEIFHSLLKEANNNIPLTDDELWGLLKVLCILEYDFLSQGSVDETYFLNLIRLSKSSSSALSEKSIWDTILSHVTKLNKDGGSVNGNTIPEEIKAHFDIQRLDPYYKAVHKIKKDSGLLFDQLANTIGRPNDRLHIPRLKIVQDISESINSTPITIVTGTAGAGKSVSVKDTILSTFSSASVFAFRADQFNQPHLANVLSNLGIHESVPDIFSSIALVPEKVIVIDSMEKLLEDIDPNNAFKQLITLLQQYPDIKLVGTARKYSIDLIFQKFGVTQLNVKVIEINQLTDEELNIVAEKYPVCIPLFENEKIKHLLLSPKYLDFALSALSKDPADYSTISLIDFKNKLWNVLIEDSTTRKSGLAAKRRKAFLNIALKRAKKMTLFVEPDDDIDDASIEALMNDEVIFGNNETTAFSPSHDILEDWALVKHIQKIYQEKSSDPSELFASLGHEPAIRRAFRLWLEDYLLDEGSKINTLIRQTLSSSKIERYWVDELLTSVFKSSDCSSFFKEFKEELLKDNGAFFARCIHVLRTTCKESSSYSTNALLLLPTGSGWKEVFHFINESIVSLEKHRLVITNLLNDWSYKLVFYIPVDEKELHAVKNITLYYLTQISNEDSFWQEKEIENRQKVLIDLLFNLANVCQKEIEQFVSTALTKTEARTSWRLNKFHDKIIDRCLSGIGTLRLTKFVPDLVIQTAWNVWKLKEREVGPEDDRRLSYLTNRLRDDECWGIQDKREFFPSGIYKTPIYNLFQFHPIKALKFVTAFINYSVDFYAQAECNYKHSFEQLHIKLADGTIVRQWAGWELWAAYRGLSVTHYLLESLLMSVEKYLLEFAAYQTEASRKGLQFMLDYIIRNSNNVALPSVAASIAMAHPTEIAEETLPLFSVPEFYQWDLNRSLQESSSSLAPWDNEISFAQEERYKSNQLVHRKKYYRGFQDFAVEYQLKVRKLNSEMLKIWDELKTKIDLTDIIQRKRLNELDIRTYYLGEFDEKIGGRPILIKYDKEVADFLAANEPNVIAQNATAKHANTISSAIKESGEIVLDEWLESFYHYQKEENLNELYDRQVALAVLGLTKMRSQITKDQKDWCVDKIRATIITIINSTFERDYDIISYNLFEKETALHSLHLLKGDIPTADLISTALYILIAPFGQHEVKELVKYFRGTFAENCPDETILVWQALIKYSGFRQSKPNFHGNPELEEKYYTEEEKFIEFLSEETFVNISIDDLSFKSSEAYLLARAFSITPYRSEPSIIGEFILKFVRLTIEDLHREKEYGFKSEEDGRLLQFEEVYMVEDYLVELFMSSQFDLAKKVAIILVSVPLDQNHSHYVDRDLTRFVLDPFKRMISHLDTTIAKSQDEDFNKALTEKFWLFWQYLFEQLKLNTTVQLIPILLFDIEWRTESTHWKPLNNKKELYAQMVTALGDDHLLSLLNVLSTIGDRTMLPDGLLWVNSILKRDSSQKNALLTTHGEQLIKRLFYNHIVRVKNSKNLIEEFVWLLDIMVDLGSSQAYLFRENVITYKKRT